MKIETVEVIVKRVDHEDCPLNRFPAEQAYLLHVLASTLCQTCNLTQRELEGVLHKFGAAVVIALEDDEAQERATRNMLQTCGGDAHTMIKGISRYMQTAIAALEEAMRPQDGKVH